MREIFAIVKFLFLSQIRKKSTWLIFVTICAYGLFLPYFYAENPTNWADLSSFWYFSFNSIFMLFFISAFIFSAFLMAKNYQSWRIFLYNVRPISGIKLFFGNLGGIFSFYNLFFCGFIGSFFLANLIFINKSIQDNNKIFTPRQEYLAEKFNWTPVVEAEMTKIIKSKGLPRGYTREVFFAEILSQFQASVREFDYLESFEFIFKNIRDKSNLRIIFTPKILGNFEEDERVFSECEIEIFDWRSQVFYPLKKEIESGVEQELKIPNADFVQDGEMKIRYINIDKEGRTINFAINNLPKIIENRGTFIANLVWLYFSFILKILFFISFGLLIGFAISWAVSMIVIFSYLFFTIFVELNLFGSWQKIMEKILISPFSTFSAQKFSNGFYINLFNSETIILCLAIITSLLLSNLIYKNRQSALVIREE